MNYSHAIGWLFLITFIVIIPARGESLGPYMKRHLAIDPRHIECSKNGSIKILVVDNPPYVITRNTSLNNGVASPVGGVLVDFFMSAIRMCYKECNITFQAFDNVKELLQAIHDYQGNIAFPVASTMAVNLTWPWYKGTPIVLQSAIQGKDRALIIHKGNYNQWLKDTMFNNLFKSWPLFALTFVFAGLSGICVWILECQSNDDFGASFSRGWFEGFWWAFVSMTTVGYGDKTPRTVLGRLFASVWIAFGLVMVAMFTATASNALMSLEFNGIAQAEVGVLSSTDASHQAAKHGAIPKRFHSFKAMHDALYADEVNAILIDQYVGAYFIDILKSDDLRMLASLSYEYTYSIAFLDDQSQHIQMECFKNIQNRYGTSSFLERYTKQLKIFDFNTDFPGLFATEGGTGYLVLLSGIALSVIVITGTVIDQLNKKYNLFGNRIFRKCCKTRIVEMSKDKTFTRDDRRDYPIEEINRPTFPRTIEVKSNSDQNIQTLREEVLRMRTTLNQILERLQNM